MNDPTMWGSHARAGQRTGPRCALALGVAMLVAAAGLGWGARGQAGAHAAASLHAVTVHRTPGVVAGLAPSAARGPLPTLGAQEAAAEVAQPLSVHATGPAHPSRLGGGFRRPSEVQHSAGALMVCILGALVGLVRFLQPRTNAAELAMLSYAGGEGQPGQPTDTPTEPTAAAALGRRQALWAGPVLTGLGALGTAAPAQAQLSDPTGMTGLGFDLDSALDPRATPQISNPGLSWSVGKAQKQLFYPAWFEGEWDVTAEFAGFYDPQGPRFLGPSVPGFKKFSILRAADCGATPVQYRVRYVYSKAEGGVVADRVFNTKSCVEAFVRRPGAVRSVEYDPVANPTRYSVVYTTPRKFDTYDQAEDVWKAELFVNNRTSATRTKASPHPLSHP